MTKWTYDFSRQGSEGGASLSDLLGGKGANLAEMASLGLPVPPGFTITTEACTRYYKENYTYPDELISQVEDALRKLGEQTGNSLGDKENPLLVSVRSGARVSMPGMMDTVLNLGLNDETVEGLTRKSGDERFAWDSYRRFVQMYGNVVLGIDHYDFEEILDGYKRDENLIQDTEIDPRGWHEIVAEYKKLVIDRTGNAFPMSPETQLWGAVGAVFKSWRTPRAVTYRNIHHIPDHWGTAVNIQAMVFGNMGQDCATGVAFTRDPGNGDNLFYGEFLINAQGEDVVAGIRTPRPIDEMREIMPQIYNELLDVRTILESHYKDMQDIEFTVQKGQLYMLQTRTGKRSAPAALKIAVEMVDEGLINQEQALQRIDARSIEQLIHPTLDPEAEKVVIAHGLPASPGAAGGRIALTADKAEEWAQSGEDVILMRKETSPEDIHGMHAARAIITTRGGMTSHAAVVARGMGRPCISGAGEIRIDMARGQIYVGDITLAEGALITVDGNTGNVISGLVPTKEPEMGTYFLKMMEWADDVRRLKVRTNAETPKDVDVARQFGAQGIGLCRTEHMFFEPDRIQAVREMIFAQSQKEREKALEKLLPLQKKDFREIFDKMRGYPVTVRLLDPPLHEFFPHGEEEMNVFAQEAGMPLEEVRRRLMGIGETNPMLGHRGCRLGITYPEIYRMQVEAILEAAIETLRMTGEEVALEIMVPLVMTAAELAFVREEIDLCARRVFDRNEQQVAYSVGTMIELPGAALRADEIARKADFFSFGTNDLTQTTLGISRDDSAGFLPYYLSHHILERDPFETLDRSGVGRLIEIAVKEGKNSSHDLKLGICGEHGGDPETIFFCERLGFDYVSCSPYRIPVARLAAAQAALIEKKEKTVRLKAAGVG